MESIPREHLSLDRINNPEDLRLLPEEALPALCGEIRQFLLGSVSNSGGHLSSGLGVVELTVALHYVYRTPFDKLVWDTGHQTYPHKIITGRRELMATVRRSGGLHPFPSPSESEYDTFSAGHSSTSISAGLGMAFSAKNENLGRRVICVIGDAAIAAGVSMEAINHSPELGVNMLVILNDNGMSISKNVGRLSCHLRNIRMGERCEGPISDSADSPCMSPQTHSSSSKGANDGCGCNLFRRLGFTYRGPLDGHDIGVLTDNLRDLRARDGLHLMHVVTRKGSGYLPAERDPTAWHSVSSFDLRTGENIKTGRKSTSYSDVFGEWLCSTAAVEPRLVAVTPAMCEGSGMRRFSQLYPDRFFDVAIAEQHAVTFAAGLAISGYKPVVSIYSTFLQRAYDQLIHDVAMQNLPVLFAVDRAGVVGPDGQTHQGSFDISYLRCVPNMVIMTPSSGDECRSMLNTALLRTEGPSVVRYPKMDDETIGVRTATSREISVGKATIRRCGGGGTAILNFGPLLPRALEVAEAIDATLVDMRFVKPLDEDMIGELTASHVRMVTLEEHSVAGGAGSAVNECLMNSGRMIPVLNIGLPDHFIPHGGRNQILSSLGLDVAGITRSIGGWNARRARRISLQSRTSRWRRQTDRHDNG